MPEPPSYRPVDARSIVGPQGFTDPWFLGRYGMNLYRGCEHGCVYCDGRAEKYRVEGRFDADIVVKQNAVDLLEAELAHVREPGFVFVGGGVSLQASFPDLLAGYARIYASSPPSGQADARYYARVDGRFVDALRRYRLPPRIPRRLFRGRIPLYTEVAVLLEHREIESRIAGLRVSGLARAGMGIQKWARGRLARAGRGTRSTWQSVEDELRSMVDDRSVLRIEGMSPSALPVLRELLDAVPPPGPALLPR